MRPFDLEAALRGEKVVTRDGREVTQLVKFDVEDCNRPVVGVVDDSIYKWSLAGGWAADSCDSILDLFMHEEPKDQWTPTMELRIFTSKRVYIGDRGQTELRQTLQQKWISGTGTANEPFKVKWRDVPTVKEEEQ